MQLIHTVITNRPQSAANSILPRAIEANFSGLLDVRFARERTFSASAPFSRTLIEVATFPETSSGSRAPVLHETKARRRPGVNRFLRQDGENSPGG
jgi:hypothetical protein